MYGDHNTLNGSSVYILSIWMMSNYQPGYMGESVNELATKAWLNTWVWSLELTWIWKAKFVELSSRHMNLGLSNNKKQQFWKIIL